MISGQVLACVPFTKLVLGCIHLEQGLGNNSPWVKSGPLPVFINKSILEHSYTHLSVCCLWLLLCDNGDLLAHKA